MVFDEVAQTPKHTKWLHSAHQSESISWCQLSTHSYSQTCMTASKHIYHKPDDNKNVIEYEAHHAVFNLIKVKLQLIGGK